MGHRQGDSGFTMTEVLVAITILGLFLGLFFQIYMASSSQSRNTVLYAAANDIAQSNLRKIIDRGSELPLCDATTTGTGNENNSVLNPALNPDASTNTDPHTGSSIPWTTDLVRESTAKTGLPESTTQELFVIYPFDCNSYMPAKVISIVTYGSSIGQKAVHEAYVR